MAHRPLCRNATKSEISDNDNILHTLPKTDGDVEIERESARHRLRSAPQSNYSLILWKLPKCWPPGKRHGLQSHCIECVLLLLLHPALRLAGGLWERPVCLHCYFQLLLLVADVSHLCGLNLSDKGGASLPPGTSFIHVSDLFLLPRPPRIHIAFISVVEGGGGKGAGGWGGRRIVEYGRSAEASLPLLLWKISTIFQQVFFWWKRMCF